ncbi:hypothetical protein B0H14DRAFT_3738520 [Mycena olivaceomarginata]|nr:hypothetical protein B0H14DRAFT_3738520 [Mycena olivaceomarginata]
MYSIQCNAKKGTDLLVYDMIQQIHDNDDDVIQYKREGETVLGPDQRKSQTRERGKNIEGAETGTVAKIQATEERQSRVFTYNRGEGEWVGGHGGTIPDRENETRQAAEFSAGGKGGTSCSKLPPLPNTHPHPHQPPHHPHWLQHRIERVHRQHDALRKPRAQEREQGATYTCVCIGGDGVAGMGVGVSGVGVMRVGEHMHRDIPTILLRY